jgi:hypothetical protein
MLAMAGQGTQWVRPSCFLVGLIIYYLYHRLMTPAQQ